MHVDINGSNAPGVYQRKPKRFCKWGHDTAVCGRTTVNKCRACDNRRGRVLSVKRRLMLNRTNRRWRAKNREKLGVRYVKDIIARAYGLSRTDVSQKMIELKTEELMCHRLLKKYKEANVNEEKHRTARVTERLHTGL